MGDVMGVVRRDEASRPRHDENSRLRCPQFSAFELRTRREDRTRKPRARYALCGSALRKRPASLISAVSFVLIPMMPDFST
jgi:hypothetical protein